MLEKALENPLDCKEIKPVHPEGNQSWIFTERTDSEAEAPILWPPGAKSQLTGKHSGAGKDRRQEGGGHRGWVGWMASLRWWTCVWANSRSWWWTGKPGMLLFLGSQRAGSDWTELSPVLGFHNSTQLKTIKHILRNTENYAEGAVIERAEFFLCKELAALCRGTDE